MNFESMKQKEVALAHGVTVQSIRNWTAEGMPRNEDGSYNLPATIRWKEDRARDEIVVESEDGDKWLGEYRKERALITKMEREQLEKKLVSVEEVEQGFSDRAYELSRRLLLMSRRIGQRLAGKTKRLYAEVCEVVDDEVRAAMNDYSRPVTIEVDPLKK